MATVMSMTPSRRDFMVIGWWKVTPVGGCQRVTVPWRVPLGPTSVQVVPRPTGPGEISVIPANAGDEGSQRS